MHQVFSVAFSMNWCWSIAFLVGVAGSLSAQTVTLNGHIIDARSGEALPYASLYIPFRRSVTLANTNGAFQLKLVSVTEADPLVVPLLGYFPYRLPLTTPEVSRKALVIGLLPAVTTLQEVIA